jgi:hypothetical protein
VKQSLERIEDPAGGDQGAYKFKTPAFARHGILAYETLNVARALQTALTSVVEGEAALNAALAMQAFACKVVHSP